MLVYATLWEGLILLRRACNLPRVSFSCTTQRAVKVGKVPQGKSEHLQHASDQIQARPVSGSTWEPCFWPRLPR